MMKTGIGVLIVISLVFLGAAVTMRNLHPTAAPMHETGEQFIVTSPADAGPGTLRDAILAADRLSTRARILINVKRIGVETPLPALVNPHGTEIDVGADAGTIDVDRQASGSALQINSPASTLHGLHILNAHNAAIIVNAPGVQLDALDVSDSKVGIFLGDAARGCAIRSAVLERNETALTADAGVRDVTVLDTTFRANTRAGFWFVGAAGKDDVQGGAGEPIREQVRFIGSTFEKNASGIVLANRPTLVQKSRFLGNRDSALLLMGGAARIENSEFRESGGTALSVSSGRAVTVSHNSFVDNAATALMVRDSEITIENNTLQHNGFGIVSITSSNSPAPVIRDNIITHTTGDAVTLIGGSPELDRNQLLDNHGAGLRSLDLVMAHGQSKAAPHLEANIIKGNGIDTPAAGVYKLADAL